MKIQQRIVAICAAAFLLADSLPMHMVQADQVLEETAEQERAEASEQEFSETSEQESTEQESTEASEQESTEQESTEASEQESTEQESTEASEQESTEQEFSETSEQEATEQESIKVSEQEPTEQESAEQESTEASDEETVYPVPDEPPAFEAHIENRMGYTVIGTFTDFTPDIIRIDTLYSLDGESWRAVTGGDWNLYGLDSDDNDTLYMLQNQSCVYNAYEPMKSFTTGDIERFYLKLRITKKNGLTYDSQPVTIEQGGIRPIPEGTTRYACFSSELIVRESVADSPYRFRMYGRYQITVPAGATVEEISALLPETLPVEIQLTHGRDLRVNGVIDCPVTWKQLSLSQLPAGETITIPDAAEEMIVPAGTQLSTPLGIFVLDEPLRVDNPPMTDEVRLVINVSPEDRALAGVLKQAPDGLMAALEQKPTGAAAIEAYVLTEGESEWTEIPGLSLLKEMNSQHSTENSGFALVLYNDQEPYRSYLEAQKAGADPEPFFIGLKIKGGIYDDRQLVLAWPDIYEELPDLPKIGRSEGNEGNAGADNKNDSTESGQRPNLPITPDEKQEEPPSQPQLTPDEKQEEPPSQPQLTPDEKQEEPSQPQLTPDEKQEEPPLQPAVTPDEDQDKPDTGHQAHNGSPGQSDTVSQKPASAETGQRPNLPHPAQNTVDIPHEEQPDTVSQKSSPIQSSVMVQAAAPRTDNDNVVVRPGTETVMEYTAADGTRIPIQTLTAATVTGLLIGAVVCNAAGCNLLDRVVVIIRNVMR